MAAFMLPIIFINTELYFNYSPFRFNVVKQFKIAETIFCESPF